MVFSSALFSRPAHQFGMYTFSSQVLFTDVFAVTDIFVIFKSASLVNIAEQVTTEVISPSVPLILTYNWVAPKKIVLSRSDLIFF